MEAGHRSVHSELEDSADIFQDGDTSICSSLGSSGRLGSVSGLEGCVLAGSNASGIAQVPQVHGGGEGVPIQGSLLWSLHGSTSLHQAHGSCVSHSSQDGGTASPVPRRLVASGFLTRAGSPCSEDSASALQVSGDRRQLGEVSGDSNTTDGLSGGHSELNYFQGFSCPEESREAFLNWRRILVLRQSACFILARAFRSAVLDDPAWPGGRLRMRSLQLALRRQWDPVDQSQLVKWSPEIRLDLEWWLNRDRLELGISLEQVSPRLELWSYASDVGWGAHLDESVSSALWAPEEVEFSINVREFLAIERALLWFAPHLVGSSVAIFADNSTAIAYLRNQGGTHSSPLNSIAQRILRWAENLPVVISPQFIMGKHNVLADALSRPNQILGSEWTLKQEV